MSGAHLDESQLLPWDPASQQVGDPVSPRVRSLRCVIRDVLSSVLIASFGRGRVDGFAVIRYPFVFGLAFRGGRNDGFALNCSPFRAIV